MVTFQSTVRGFVKYECLTIVVLPDLDSFALTEIWLFLRCLDVLDNSAYSKVD